MKTPFALAAALATAISLPAAGQKLAAQNRKDSAVIRLGRAPASTLDQGGNQSRIRTARTAVARDTRGFTALWREHAGDTATPPNVDFGKYDVVAVFAGMKSTAGYSVRIDSVIVRSGAATVAATILKPSPATLTAQVITFPFRIKTVAKLPATVRFDVKEQVSPPR